MARKRWEAELLASTVVARLAVAMGGGPQAGPPASRGTKSEPGNRDRVSPDELLGMMGMKV